MARETTFINGFDVVRKLERYVMDGHLTSTTKFITADVTDLYTMIPREGALDALARFCIRYKKTRQNWHIHCRSYYENGSCHFGYEYIRLQ